MKETVTDTEIGTETGIETERETEGGGIVTHLGIALIETGLLHLESGG